MPPTISSSPSVAAPEARVDGLSPLGRECPAYRLPQVREPRLRLEPAAPDAFGGLVGSRSAPPLQAVSSTIEVRGAHS
jgi:hypothetical protein